MMRRRCRASTIVARPLAAATALAAFACGAPSRPPGTVVFASGADLESANPLVTVHPLARQVQRYVLFVTLARYDDTLAPAPYYARRWEWSADRRALTLHLAGGLRWQDGVPTTARDVAFTLAAARDPATGYPRASELADVRAVRAPDDTTVVVDFGRPPPRFPALFAELPIVPAHILDTVPREAMRRAAFDLRPVGNGPFNFVERRAGERWVFGRNADFPAVLGGPPTLNRIVIAIVDEAATKFAGLVSGELDVAGIAPRMAHLAAVDEGLRVLDYPVLMTYGIVFNVARAPFDDVRVRRAIALAIDRRRIVNVALAGYGTPASGPVPPDHPFAASYVIQTETARADSLLDAAGWRRGPDGGRARDGRPLRLQLLTVVAGDNAVEQLLQADLAAIGIHVDIRQRELASFLAEARSTPKRFDALFTGIPGDLSLAYLSSMFDSHLAGGALDYSGYHTPALDSLLARARDAATSATQREAWLVVQRALDGAMPVAWVYHARGVQGLSRRLRDVRMDLRGEMVSIARWSVASGDTPRRVAGAP